MLCVWRKAAGVVALARAPREEDDENPDEGEDAENTAEPVTDEPGDRGGITRPQTTPIPHQ